MHPGRRLEFKEERKSYRASTAVVRDSFLFVLQFLCILYSHRLNLVY